VPSSSTRRAQTDHIEPYRAIDGSHVILCWPKNSSRTISWKISKEDPLQLEVEVTEELQNMSGLVGNDVEWIGQLKRTWKRICDIPPVEFDVQGQRIDTRTAEYFSNNNVVGVKFKYKGI